MEAVISEPQSELREVKSQESESRKEDISVDQALAYVYGQPFSDLPQDLYIPPQALEVFLEAFEGPLDLLLYLIRKQNLNILDIQVAEITHQYMEYVELMRSFHLELAAEYLVMAATLGEIKSRFLLPRPAKSEEEEQDPRQELIRRLQEYERFKLAAQQLDSLPRLERDLFPVCVPQPSAPKTIRHPDVNLPDLLFALKEVMVRANMYEHHHVTKEKLSTRERMTRILSALKGRQFVPFVELFDITEGRGGVVVTFIAMLELIKESLIEIVQHETFASIYLATRLKSIEGEP